MTWGNDGFRAGRLTFRTKILLSFLGMILLITGILMAVLERETSTQIKAAIQDAMAKSQTNFQELESTWKAELASACRRFSASPRIVGAFDAALEEMDPGVLAEAAEYETRLAALSDYLILFIEPGGRILCSLQQGRAEPGRKSESVPIEPIPAGESSFDYRVFRGQLYAAYVEPLQLFTRKIGYVQIGFPLREKLVRNLGEWVNGQVSFIVDSRVIIATPDLASSSLLEDMKSAAIKNLPRPVTFSGQSWAVFSELLSPKKPAEGSMVFAIPLQKALAPFQRLRSILILTALGGAYVAITLAFLLSKGLTAPILELVRGTDRIAHGHLDFRVNIKSNDELGSLGRAFNSMAQGLHLKEKYRDILDKVVSPEIASEMLKNDMFLGGENRVVTTLFADIRGFTQITAARNPRDVITLLNEYLEDASTAVEKEGGVVDKYMGDEIMAIFGAPVAHTDDALRAIRAALRIQEVIRDLNELRRATGAPQFAVGIGINTGLAVAGNMGSRKRLNYTVLGEPVNLAARLCSAAEAGQILISASTLDAAGPCLDIEDKDSIALKGLSRPVPIWAVRGLKKLPEGSVHA